MIAAARKLKRCVPVSNEIMRLHDMRGRGRRAYSRGMRRASRSAAPAFHRKLDELGLAFDFELALDVEPVRFHRPHRQPVSFRDLLARQTFSQRIEDL